MKDPGRTIQRWLDFIQEFNFTVTPPAGEHNVNAYLISRARYVSEPTLSNEGTITQNTVDVYRLPWLSGDKYPALEHYTPPLCTGRVYSVVELPWNLAVYNSMKCSGPP